MGKLTALFAKTAPPGRHADGDGLYLLVKPSGAKSWLLRVQSDGRRRDLGLGSLSMVSLAEAREKSAAYRKEVRSGVDPVVERKKARCVVPTFREAATICHSEMKGGWRNAKHAAQWLSTLETYAVPAFGSMPVDQVDSRVIRDALAPIWLSIPETAKRTHQRISTVLDYAQSKGWRTNDAPKSVVLKGLPKQKRRAEHFAALPFADLPAFMAALRGKPETVGRLALMFTILTAARSGEVRGAMWSEVDLAEALWKIPADRMKAGREHVVPLSDEALAILERAKLLDYAADNPVFPGNRGQLLSDMTLTKILRDAHVPVTVHGFRSSFRDWAAEETDYPGEVVEKALAHTIPNRVEAAYRRTDFLAKRRELMKEWANYIAGRKGDQSDKIGGQRADA